MRLRQVGKRYRLTGAWVLRDVDLALEAGGAMRVEGANGSGKSTLLRLVAGVCEPSTGTITGRPRTGYVPERFPPALPFTVRSYLGHLTRVHGVGTDAGRRLIDDCVSELSLESYVDAPLRTLSKGTSQKVALAQAVVTAPELLVLDEAWTGLDDATRSSLDNIVVRRLAAGGSVVFVDHNPDRLAGLSTARWQVAAGRVTERRVDRSADEVPSEVVVIDVDGCSASAARLTALPGVLEVATPAAVDRPGATDRPGSSDRPANGARTLRVLRGESDTILRALLGDRAVHVRTVREERAGHASGRRVTGEDPR